MINKQDLIHFVDECKIESKISALVIVSDDKRVCHLIEGDETTFAAVLFSLARENPDFKKVLITAAAFSMMKGCEE